MTKDSESTQDAFRFYDQNVADDDLELAKASIKTNLLSEGVACVWIHYNGERDNGQINEIWILEGDRNVQLREADGSVRSRHDLVRALEEFAWMVLGARVHGFEVADGGTGYIKINPKCEEDDFIMHTSRETSIVEV